jgi:hypothetical protein
LLATASATVSATTSTQPHSPRKRSRKAGCPSVSAWHAISANQ